MLLFTSIRLLQDDPALTMRIRREIDDMNGRVLRQWVACSWLLGSWVLAAGDPPAVEVISSLQISGNHDFTTDEILNKLRSHPQALQAAARSTKEWHAVAPALLLSGYHSLGYADATVTMTGRGQLLISEGPHYKTGDIRITGATDSLALAIRTQLNGTPPKENRDHLTPAPTLTKPTVTIETQTRTEQKQEANEQAWKSGVSRDFNEPTRKHLEELAMEAIELDGRTGGQLTVHYEREPATAQMHLAVEVTDAGHPVEVNEFEIEGLTRNTPAELIQYLGLEPGPLSLADRRAVEVQLHESARFLGHRVELVAPFRKTDPHRLFIHVKECAGAPKLTEPFTPEQVALLKVRDWLENFETRGHQWVISGTRDPVVNDQALWHDGRFDLQLILSPSHQYGLRFENTRHSDGLLRGYLIGVSQSWFSIASHQTGRQLLVRKPDSPSPRPFLTVDFLGIDVPHKKENVSLMFGYGINSRKNPPPLKVQVDPAALLYTPDDETLQMHIAAGVLHVESTIASTRIDAETGRLLSSQIKMPDESVKESLQFSTEPDNFDAVWKGWVEPRQFVQSGATDRPVTSLIEFVIDEWDLVDPAGAIARRAVMKLIGPDLLAAADQEFSQPRDKEQGEFNIPWEKAGIAANVAGAVLKLDGQLLRPDSTASEVARGLIRTVLDESPENHQRLLQEVSRPDCGPLSCVVFGTLASWSTPAASPLMGRLGLGRLSEGSFEEDLNQWLDERQIIGQAAIRIVERVRDLTDEEAAALVTLCGNPQIARLLTEIMDELRASVAIQAPEEAQTRDLQRFSAALTRLWTPLIRPYVELQLIRLATAKKPPTA